MLGLKILAAVLLLVFVVTALYYVHVEHRLEEARVFSPVTSICNATTRQQYISRICEEEGWVQSSWNTLSSEMSNILVDNKHRILYFMIPKVGSLSFRTMFGRLSTGNASFEFPHDCTRAEYLELTGLSNFILLSASEKEFAINTYAKFVVIRHPLDRLRAIYDAKLNNTPSQSPVILDKDNRKHIDDYFKENGIIRDKFNPRKESLTFEQFLDIVGSKYEQGFQNSHWKPMMERSWPCNIKYDIIIRLESIEIEQVTLLNYLRLYEKNTSLIDIPHENQHLSKSSGMDRKLQQLSEQYKDIPPAVIRKLEHLYEQDFRVFGYGWDERRKEAYCSMSKSTDSNCC